MERRITEQRQPETEIGLGSQCCEDSDGGCCGSGQRTGGKTPDSVLTRIENAISDAMSDPCEPVTAIASPTQSARSAQTPSPVDTAAERTSAIQERLVASLSADFKPSESVEAPHLPGQAYEPYRSSEPVGDPDAFYQRMLIAGSHEVMERVLEVEGPVSFDTLVRRVAAQYSYQRSRVTCRPESRRCCRASFAKRQKADDTVAVPGNGPSLQIVSRLPEFPAMTQTATMC